MVVDNPNKTKQAPLSFASFDKTVATFVALLLFGFYMLTFDGTLHSTDGLSMLAVAENWLKHGRLDTRQLENWETTYLSVVGLALHHFDGVADTPDEVAALAAANTLATETRLDTGLLQELEHVYMSVDGRPYVVWALGPTLFMLPFLGLAWAVPHIGLTQTVMSLVPLFTALSGVYLYLSSRRLGYSPPVGVGVALVSGLMTTTWPYTRDLTAEPLALFSFSAAFYYALAYRQERKLSQAAGMGLALGLAVLHKAPNAVTLPFFFGYMLAPPVLPLRPFNRQKLRAAIPWPALLLAGAGCALCLLIIALYNTVRFGDPSQTGYPSLFSTPFRVGFTGFIISPYKSLFLYGPIFLLIPFTLPPSWRRHPYEVSLILAILLIHLIIFGAWYDWGGGKSWGPRFLVPLNGLLCLLLLPYLERVFQPGQGLYRLGFLLLGSLSLGMQLVALSARDEPYLQLSSYWAPASRSLWGELSWSQSDQWPIWGHLRRFSLDRIPVIWRWQWGDLDHFDTLSLMVLLLILIIALLGLGFALSRRRVGPGWGAAAWGLALLCVGIVLWRSYDDPRSIKRDDETDRLWPAYSALVQQLPHLVEATDAVIFTNRRFEFYLFDMDKSAAQRYIVAKDTQPLILTTIPRLLEEQAGRGQVWLVTDDLDNREIAYATELWLGERGQPVAHHLFGSSVQLTAFQLDQPPPWPPLPARLDLDQVVNPDDHRFEGIAALVGWDWPEVDATSPITLQPGQSYNFHLYWLYRGKAPEDRFFVRLLSEAGEPVFQQFTEPRPEARLIPGQLLIEDALITVPAELPAGVYQLQLGFQIPVVESGELTFPLSEDISQIEVGP